MTRDEFIAGYNERSGFSEEDARSFWSRQDAVKCDCNESGCKGYAVVQKPPVMNVVVVNKCNDCPFLKPDTWNVDMDCHHPQSGGNPYQPIFNGVPQWCPLRVEKISITLSTDVK